MFMHSDPSQIDPPERDSSWERYVAELSSGPQPSFEQQWARFEEIHAQRSEQDGPPLVWRPGEDHLSRSNLGRVMRELGFGDYHELHAWSVSERGEFWAKTIERLGIVFATPPASIIGSSDVKHPAWLTGARLNCVDSCFRTLSDKVAVVSGREGSPALLRTSYGELERLVNRVANGLLEHGFQEGDAIALHMPMTLECVAAYLGIVRAGCRVVSIADSFSPAEVRRRMEIGGARSIITVTSFTRAGKVIELYGKVLEAATSHAIVIAISPGEESELRAGDLAWSDLLSDDHEFASHIANPYAVTNVLFSSGTTADPKAIPWTHLTAIKCAMDGHFHQDIQPGDVVCWPTNIGWMMGPWLIYAALINRATIALYEGAPFGGGFTDFVADAGVAMLGTVPSLVRAWRTSGSVPPDVWSGVRVFSSTGEPSNREDYLWLMSRAGYRAPVIEYCGGTEIGGGYITGTVVQPASPATFTTPALGLDFLIVDEKGDPVEEGGEGELFLVPPSIGLSESLLNRDHDEVYYQGCPAGPDAITLRRHGDQMVRLAGGYFKAHGRADDTMNLGGIKVSSRELEVVIDTHPAVYESAAVAVQLGDEGGDRLVVYVVAQQDADVSSLRAELGAMIAERLNPLFRIFDLMLVDSLPRTASNKLMRRSLRAAYASR